MSNVLYSKYYGNVCGVHNLDQKVARHTVRELTYRAFQQDLVVVTSKQELQLY